MKLILMRHAKSDWGGLALGDKARPLNERGRKAAPKMGRWMRTNGHIPDRVLVSDAERTRETWGSMAKNFPEAEVSFSSALYLAEPDTMLSAIKHAQGETLMMIAHNPGIAVLADALVAVPPDHVKFHQYPTAAVLVAEFTGNSWVDLRPESLAVLDFIVPKDIPA